MIANPALSWLVLSEPVLTVQRQLSLKSHRNVLALEWISKNSKYKVINPLGPDGELTDHIF